MMKKLLSLLLLSALLLCAGCQPVEAETQKEAASQREPAAVSAQNITFSAEDGTSTQEETESVLKEDPLNGVPLEEHVTEYVPGDIPTPEPVVPPTETE